MPLEMHTCYTESVNKAFIQIEHNQVIKSNRFYDFHSLQNIIEVVSGLKNKVLRPV